ncbi:MAG TPA: hypothetical protein VGG19_09430 [Tepidisphaeraceae bacterium]|jgi:hypothetical protein
MFQSQEIEDLLCLVASLDRPALIEQFRQCPATFPLDFTDEFLRNTPLDRLKHIFMAICLQSNRSGAITHAA